ncbi:MAG: tyrosine-protein phosphatase [Alphaproteobacteria bacterium]|nr:MAG: tyrosine-protein phosphatase [Alphaproteobacteria bacterium]
MIRERFQPMSGIHNFRDYGGYSVADGGRVRHGLLYRSGQHMEASDADLARLDELDIRTVIDLRGESERSNFPCRRAPDFSAHVIFYEGETTSSPPHEAAGASGMTPQMAFDRMKAVYTRMPNNPAMIDMFGRYFRALDEREGASLVHCFAGKDRTGIAAALLLHVLGAHEDDIMGEYLLTNRAPGREILIRQSVPRMEAIYGPMDPDAISNLMDVRPEYLDTYRAAINQQHGSVDHFISRTLGVDEAMRKRLHSKLVA